MVPCFDGRVLPGRTIRAAADDQRLLDERPIAPARALLLGGRLALIFILATAAASGRVQWRLSSGGLRRGRGEFGWTRPVAARLRQARSRFFINFDRQFLCACFRREGLSPSLKNIFGIYGAR